MHKCESWKRQKLDGWLDGYYETTCSKVFQVTFLGIKNFYMHSFLHHLLDKITVHWNTITKWLGGL